MNVPSVSATAAAAVFRPMLVPYRPLRVGASRPVAVMSGVVTDYLRTWEGASSGLPRRRSGGCGRWGLLPGSNITPRPPDTNTAIRLVGDHVSFLARQRSTLGGM